MSLKENSSYQKALTDLSAWDNPPEGFVFPSEENTASKVQKLLKQNNFIIALLVQQSEKKKQSLMEQRANSGSQATTSNQEDQVRNYRLMQRARYQAGRLLRPRRRFQNTLESQI